MGMAHAQNLGRQSPRRVRRRENPLPKFVLKSFAISTYMLRGMHSEKNNPSHRPVALAYARVARPHLAELRRTSLS